MLVTIQLAFMSVIQVVEARGCRDFIPVGREVVAPPPNVEVRRGRRPSVWTDKLACSRQDLADDLGMALRDANQSLRCARWRPAPLLPLLQRAL